MCVYVPTNSLSIYYVYMACYHCTFHRSLDQECIVLVLQRRLVSEATSITAQA